AYVIKLDGNCLRPSPTIPGKLLGNPEIWTSAGTNGNLGNEESLYAGDVIDIPYNVGRYSTSISPLTMEILGEQFSTEGVFAIVAVLMENDGIPNESLELGHLALTDFIKEKIEDALTSLNWLNILAGADNIPTGIAAGIFLVNSIFDLFTNSNGDL